MAPATHFVLRIVAILLILVAYLLPHRHRSEPPRIDTTESAVAQH